MIECRIHLRAADELGVHPTIMFGRLGDGKSFPRDELVYALSSNGKSWHRRRQESAEVFEARIVRDMQESVGASCQGTAVLE
jgi:hypothetical protein